MITRNQRRASSCSTSRTWGEALNLLLDAQRQCILVAQEIIELAGQCLRRRVKILGFGRLKQQLTLAVQSETLVKGVVGSCKFGKGNESFA